VIVSFSNNILHYGVSKYTALSRLFRSIERVPIQYATSNTLPNLLRPPSHLQNARSIYWTLHVSRRQSHAHAKTLLIPSSRLHLPPNFKRSAVSDCLVYCQTCSSHWEDL